MTSDTPASNWAAADRRSGLERRRRAVSIRFPERRTGFDQRLPESGRLRRGWHTMIRSYSGNRTLVLLVLGLIFALNAADLALTINAIDRGAIEANPLMARMLMVDPAAAATFKMAMAGAVAVSIWLMRRYRRMLEASIVIAAGFALLLAYHGLVATRLY